MNRRRRRRYWKRNRRKDRAAKFRREARSGSGKVGHHGSAPPKLQAKARRKVGSKATSWVGKPKPPRPKRRRGHPRRGERLRMRAALGEERWEAMMAENGNGNGRFAKLKKWTAIYGAIAMLIGAAYSGITWVIGVNETQEKMEKLITEYELLQKYQAELERVRQNDTLQWHTIRQLDGSLQSVEVTTDAVDRTQKQLILPMLAGKELKYLHVPKAPAKPTLPEDLDRYIDVRQQQAPVLRPKEGK